MTERRCTAEGCDTILSRFNATSWCAAHEGPGTIAAAEAAVIHGTPGGRAVCTAGPGQTTCDDCLATWRTGRPDPERRECRIDGCTGEVQARDLCASHYRRLRVYGDPLATVYEKAEGTCADCPEPAYAKGRCRQHYQADYQRRKRAS